MSRVDSTGYPFQPQPGHDTPASPDPQRVNPVVERFEAAWHALELEDGPAPRVEDFVRNLSGTGRRSTLRDLIEAERSLRRTRGDEPRPGEYLARFPDDASVVRAVFARAAPAADFVVGTTDRPVGDGTTAFARWHAKTESLGGGLRESGDTGSGVAATVARTVSPNEGGTEPLGDEPGPEPLPETVGRYQVVRLLGEGAFGRVYLARDEALGRSVALKVPRRSAFRSPQRVEQFLREARSVGSMKHPAIVTVHDIGLADDGAPFLVLEYVDGRPLSTAWKAEPFGPRRLAGLLAEVAEALHHAHERGFVHRDLKPENLLIDWQGNPHVADFGLAQPERWVVRPGSREVAGTPAYMAPEQVRGESHRIDRRTDLWGLGVVFYQLLTGRLPFRGSCREALFADILRRDPVPPRLVDPTIPRELERVCLKCLTKRMADRYATAHELADDLRFWTAEVDHRGPVRWDDGGEIIGVAGEARVRVVPKGLRAFDAADAEFYLALLPGPFDRNGLPEALRFWKSRVESTEPGEAFAVGLLYGPSGCGKSSLVQAGLLPRLGGHVRAVPVEATPDGTEASLLRALRRACPGLPDGLGLAEAMLALRESPALRKGRKLLVVLDQFEQWLHAHDPERPGGEALVEALRQCDGPTVQALLTVRDDFGMAAMRFMSALEVPVVEGKNYATVDRFDPKHAAAVLESFGRALGCLPAEGPPGDAGARFVEKAVEGLAEFEGGKVAPLRLALFAEMFRDKPWTPASLRRVGGAEGIGLTFLEESLGPEAPDPRRRTHREAAREVLQLLLPEPGSDLKGHTRPRAELLAASPYSGKPEAFDDLLRLLDGELRLVTPCPPSRSAGSAEAGPAPELHYQLTHDDLVPSLRKWLTRTRGETASGRAGLLLELRAGVWSTRPERRYLPSLLEWFGIELLTRRSDRTASQSKMMRAATRHHGLRLAAAGAAAVVLLGTAVAALEENQRQRRESRARDLVERIYVTDVDHLGPVLDLLEPYKDAARARLARAADDPRRPHRERTNAQVALARSGACDVAYLVERLLAVDPREHAVIAETLRSRRGEASAALWSAIEAPDPTGARHVRAAVLLAELDPSHPRWESHAASVVRGLVAEGPATASSWVESFGPVRDWLDGPLTEVFRNSSRLAPERAVAAEALASLFERDDPERLAALAAEADPDQFVLLVPHLAARKWSVVPALSGLLDRPEPADPASRERLAARKANAAVALLRLGESGAVWRWLRADSDPAVRARLVHRMIPLGVDETVLFARLGAENDPAAGQAILLALGETSVAGEAAPRDDAIVDQVARLYQTDREPAVHSAAEWLLRRWGHSARLATLRDGLKGVDRGGWWVNAEGQTFLVVRSRPGGFRMGTPGGVELRDTNETPHERRINRDLAVTAHEVTVGQFLKSQPDHAYDPQVCPDDDGPVTKVSWYDAARYCRWLDDQDPNLPESEKCYPARDEIGPGFRLPADFLERKGHRLPTEAEWEMLARAGTTTPWFFGETPELLPRYAWFASNAGNHTRPGGLLKPNPLGLFDVYGNAAEWCQDSYGPYPTDDPDDPGRIDPVGDRVYRGGAYRSVERFARSGMRTVDAPEGRSSLTGFRVVRTVRVRAKSGQP